MLVNAPMLLLRLGLVMGPLKGAAPLKSSLQPPCLRVIGPMSNCCWVPTGITCIIGHINYTSAPLLPVILCP